MCGEWDSFTTYSTRLPGARTKSAEKTVTLEESAYLLDTGMNEQTTREELKAKRNLLFERFSKNPSEIHLAIEIKSMDDQVAEGQFIATDKES